MASLLLQRRAAVVAELSCGFVLSATAQAIPERIRLLRHQVTSDGKRTTLTPCVLTGRLAQRGRARYDTSVMNAPAGNERRVPPYVALVRIGAVIGMSVMLAFGIFFFIGGWWVAGLVGLVLAIPFFVVMRLVESIADPGEQPPDESPNDPPDG